MTCFGGFRDTCSYGSTCEAADARILIIPMQNGKELFVLSEQDPVPPRGTRPPVIRNGATCTVYAFTPKIGPEDAVSASLVPLRSFFTGGCARGSSGSCIDVTRDFSSLMLKHRTECRSCSLQARVFISAARFQLLMFNQPLGILSSPVRMRRYDKGF